MIASTGSGYIWEDFTEEKAIWKELGGHSKWEGQPWASGEFRELQSCVHDQMPGRRKSQMMLAWCLGEDIWIFSCGQWGATEGSREEPSGQICMQVIWGSRGPPAGGAPC